MNWGSKYMYTRMKNMIDMFGREYIQGYTAALQDVISVIENIEYDLKLHKRKRNKKTYKQIVECMLDNRAILRSNPNAFVRCNDDVPGGFEVFITK